MEIKCNGKKLTLGKKTLIMGILNVTPDSFSDGGKFNESSSALKHAKKMIKEGADIIDIGGESTRPGAPKISVEEELGRVIPILKLLRDKLDVLISVDTSKAKVAKKALENGANIINDVWGFQREPEIAKHIAKHDALGIAMHNKQKKSPTKHNLRDIKYEKDIMKEIKDFFKVTFDIAKSEGLSKEKIILDPGIGFGKKAEESIEVMSRLEELNDLGCPLLLGTSRKSFIGKILDLDTNQRLEGTLATNIIGAIKGYDIIRVHDVLEHKRALTVTDKIMKRENNGFF
ncbi:MAG: dihydropteroate synthase [Bacillota bacterium]